MAKKMMSKVEQMQNQTNNDYTRKKEGEVTIEYNKTQDKSKIQNPKSKIQKDGDYVDFEEIKD